MANDSQIWKHTNNSPDYFTWTSILFSQRPIFDDTGGGGGGGGGQANANHNSHRDFDNLNYNDYNDVATSTMAATTNDANRTTPSLPELFVSSIADIAVNATTAVIDESLANNSSSLYYQVKASPATNDTEVFDSTTGANDARASVEGNNFMLLFEDFGEYFYNYNGTGFNESSISNLPFNCSGINNGTNCSDTQESK